MHKLFGFNSNYREFIVFEADYLKIELTVLG